MSGTFSTSTTIIATVAKRLSIDGQPQVFSTNMQVSKSRIVPLLEGHFDLLIRQILAAT